MQPVDAWGVSYSGVRVTCGMLPARRFLHEAWLAVSDSGTNRKPVLASWFRILLCCRTLPDRQCTK